MFGRLSICCVVLHPQNPGPVCVPAVRGLGVTAPELREGEGHQTWHPRYARQTSPLLMGHQLVLTMYTQHIFVHIILLQLDGCLL